MRNTARGVPRIVGDLWGSIVEPIDDGLLLGQPEVLKRMACKGRNLAGQNRTRRV
jgi:hypothetical protein